MKRKYIKIMLYSVTKLPHIKKCSQLLPVVIRQAVRSISPSQATKHSCIC